MDDTDFYRIIGAVNYIADGRFRHAAFLNEKSRAMARVGIIAY